MSKNVSRNESNDTGAQVLRETRGSTVENEKTGLGVHNDNNGRNF